MVNRVLGVVYIFNLLLNGYWLDIIMVVMPLVYVFYANWKGNFYVQWIGRVYFCEAAIFCSKMGEQGKCVSQRQVCSLFLFKEGEECFLLLFVSYCSPLPSFQQVYRSCFFVFSPSASLWPHLKSPFFCVADSSLHHSLPAYLC